MILKYIYIEKYKKLRNFELKISNGRDKNPYITKLYKDINITAIVGENGSGKTTILSFIALVFRNLQRFHKKIPCNFKLIYNLDNNSTDIVLCKTGNGIQITAYNRTHYLLEYNIKKHKYCNDNNYDNYITYDDIIDLLPSNIIISCCDIDYPNSYSYNYCGHRILEIQNIISTYTYSSFGMDYSKGIILFACEYFSRQNKELKQVFDFLGITFYSKLLCYEPQTLSGLSFGCKKDIADNLIFQCGYKDWNQFLIKVGYKYKEDFINYIFSEDYWNKYISSNEDDYSRLSSVVYDKCLNIDEYLNDFFYNSEFIILLIENQYVYINEFLLKKNNDILSLKMLSTGEKIFFCRLFYILSKIQDDSIVIIEEPEMHLNYSWIKQIIGLLINLMSNYKTHIFISTHSQATINSLYQDNIFLLQNGKAVNPDFNTFLANDKEINKRLFKRSINRNIIEEQIVKIIKDSSTNELYDLIDILGESYLKYLVFQKIKLEEEKNVES